MKWYTKLLILLSIGTLVFFIGGLIYVITAKYQMNEYALQVAASFNAATMVNASETHTDAPNAVVARYDECEAVIVPENYKALVSYLRRDHAMPFFSIMNKDTALHISICDRSHLYIAGDPDGQGATIHFDSMGKTYRMHVRGGDLWDKILTISTKGSSKYPNISLPADSKPL